MSLQGNDSWWDGISVSTRKIFPRKLSRETRISLPTDFTLLISSFDFLDSSNCHSYVRERQNQINITWNNKINK